MINGETRGTSAPKIRDRDHSTRLPVRAVYYLLAALLLVVSIAWRTGNLNAFSLSNDEGAYLMWAWLVHSGHPLYSETVSVSAPLFIVLLDWAFDLVSVSLASGRALVLGFFGLTLVSLMWVGRLLHHRLAGLVAALVFSLAPLTFILSRMAIGEIPSVALATLSLALALIYWRGGGWGWLALSGLALSLSLLLKVLNPLVGLPILWLIVTRHRGEQASWSQVIKSLALWGGAGLLPVVVCLLSYDPAALYDQAVAFRFELRTAFPWLLSNSLTRLQQFGGQHWGIIGLSLAGVLLLVGQARWETLLVVGLWLGGGLISVLFHSPLFLHHTVILLPPLAVLAGISFAETATLLRERRWAWSMPGLVGGLIFLLALPGAIQANQTVQTASFGRETEAIALLERVTSPTDNVISDNLLLPFMAGRQTPPALGDIAQVAINSGRQTSRRLITISETYPVEAVANWALRLPYLDGYMDWVEKNYLVRRVWDDHHTIYFGRRVAIDQIPSRINAYVGDSIELLGYDVGGNEHTSGGRGHDLEVTLYWQVEDPVREDYTVFVQLLDPSGELATQHDGQPLHGYLPTGDWSPGEVIPDRHFLTLSEDLPPGRYQLIAGMYLLEKLERLPVRTSDSQAVRDYVVLTELEIGD